MDSLYERLGARYLTSFAVLSVVVSLAFCPVAVWVGSIFIDYNAADWLRLLAAVYIAIGIGLGWATYLFLQEARRVERWIREGRPAEGAVDIWATAVRLPVTSIRTAGWRAALLVALPVAVYAAFEVDLSVGGAAVLFVGMLMAGLFPALFNFFLLEIYLQPLLTDIADRLPAGFALERPRLPLRLKLMASLPMITLATGWFVSVFSDPDRSLNELGAGAFLTIAVSLTVSLALTFLFTESILRPVEELVSAADRVKAGDLSARARLVSEDEFGSLTSSFNEMLDGLEDRERLSDALGSYVAPEVASRVLEEGTKLEPQRVEATIVFVDIRDFTSYSERQPPEQTLARLTEFLELIVPIVGAHGGHVNKFLGGGLIAVFGAPTPIGDHADRGLAAAFEIATRVGERYLTELKIGIGINSGEVLVGTVGGGGRMEFTVIGDPVNVAGRVERLTRRTGDVILMTEATRAALVYTSRKLLPKGEIPVKGRVEPLTVYSVSLPATVPLGDPSHGHTAGYGASGS
jgi:class 3 adenylate cyclase